MMYSAAIASTMRMLWTLPPSADRSKRAAASDAGHLTPPQHNDSSFARIVGFDIYLLPMVMCQLRTDAAGKGVYMLSFSGLPSP